jgi:hypothetical protein
LYLTAAGLLGLGVELGSGIRVTVGVCVGIATGVFETAGVGEGSADSTGCD